MARDYEPSPALAREVNEEDKPLSESRDTEEKILSTPKDTITRTRGLGASGYKIQVVKHDCPNCGFDRMVRQVRENPERSNYVSYWCLYPNCAHYLRDYLSHAFPLSYPEKPANPEPL